MKYEMDEVLCIAPVDKWKGVVLNNWNMITTVKGMPLAFGTTTKAQLRAVKKIS
jgi:hypothetical protein